MGFRTVVMLSNDRATEWEKDAKLGEKIARAMNYANRNGREREAEIDSYGRVVQCVHADTQSLVVLDGYTFCTELSGKQWTRNQEQNEISFELLKRAASEMGYRLSKIPSKK